jgi:hypothetical protein
VFWLTLPCEMPPKPRQLHAPWTKQPGNTFQALVDLPEDGSNSTFDGRDGKVDGTDENTIEIRHQCISTAVAPPKTMHKTTRDQFYDWTSDLTRFTQNAYLSDFSEERGAMDLVKNNHSKQQPPPAFSITTWKSPDFRVDSYSAASICLCTKF